MNELVNEDRGILVKVNSWRQLRWGQYAEITPEFVEAAVNTALSLSDEEYLQRASNAREWFLKNDRDFKKKVAYLVERIEKR